MKVKRRSQITSGITSREARSSYSQKAGVMIFHFAMDPGMFSKKCSMPLPAEWNATPSESNLIARFYKEVLRLEDVSRYTVILEELKVHRTKFRKYEDENKGNQCKDMPNLYQGLEDLNFEYTLQRAELS